MLSKGNKVIVVGLGPAGLKATQELLNAGYEVIAIEARDRVGGRVHSIVQDTKTGETRSFNPGEKLGDHETLLETGANWIHDAGKNSHTGHLNPMVSLANAAGMATIEQDVINSAFLGSGGTPLSKMRLLTVAKKMSAILDYEDILNDSANNRPDPSAPYSVTQALDADKRTSKKGNFKSDTGFLSSREFAEFVIGCDMGGVPLDQVSTFGFHSGYDGDDLVVTGGYNSIPHLLYQSIANHPKCQIKLGQTVTAIENYKGNGPIQVTLNDGTRLESDLIVSTLPLGILQRSIDPKSTNPPVKFDPPMDERKTQALMRMKCSYMNKVFLHFDEDFWIKHGKKAQYILPLAKLKAGDKSVSIHNFSSFHPGKPTLMLGIYGDEAQFPEDMSNDDIIKKYSDYLRDVFGDDFQEPIGGYVTRWHQDEHSLSSWGVIGAEMDYADVYELLQYPAGRLIFAGDAAADGTVHSALESGVYAAMHAAHLTKEPDPEQQPLVFIINKINQSGDEHFNAGLEQDTEKQQSILIENAKMIEKMLPQLSLENLLMLQKIIADRKYPMFVENFQKSGNKGFSKAGVQILKAIDTQIKQQYTSQVKSGAISIACIEASYHLGKPIHRPVKMQSAAEVESSTIKQRKQI